jgi:hypothetical protein
MYKLCGGGTVGHRRLSTATIIFLNTTARHSTMKTRIVTIYWDAEKDLTTYEWSPDFKYLHKIEKLDTLQDAIRGLSEEYDKELKNE